MDHSSSLLGLDFFNLDDVSLNAAGQSLVILQASQRGLNGVQIVCPNPTCVRFQTPDKNQEEEAGYVTVQCFH